MKEDPGVSMLEYVMGLGPLVLELIRDKGRLVRGQVKPCLGFK